MFCFSDSRWSNGQMEWGLGWWWMFQEGGGCSRRVWSYIFLVVSVSSCIFNEFGSFYSLGIPRNISECLPPKLKIPNNPMTLLHAVLNLKLTAIHHLWTAVNLWDFARQGVSPILNGNSWFVKRRLSPPEFKRRLQPWPPCVVFHSIRQ